MHNCYYVGNLGTGTTADETSKKCTAAELALDENYRPVWSNIAINVGLDANYPSFPSAISSERTKDFHGNPRFIGTIENVYERRFHGELFRDNEHCSVYVYTRPVDAAALRLQPDEVERVDWFDLEEVYREIGQSRERFCVPRDGLALLRRSLEDGEQ